MKLMDHHFLASIAYAGLGAAGASTAPMLLVEAAAAFTRSSAGLAARWMPTELQERNQPLEVGEAQPGTPDVAPAQVCSQAQVDVERLGRFAAEARLAAAIRERSPAARALQEGWE